MIDSRVSFEWSWATLAKYSSSRGISATSCWNQLSEEHERWLTNRTIYGGYKNGEKNRRLTNKSLYLGNELQWKTKMKSHSVFRGSLCRSAWIKVNKDELSISGKMISPVYRLQRCTDHKFAGRVAPNLDFKVTLFFYVQRLENCTKLPKVPELLMLMQTSALNLSYNIVIFFKLGTFANSHTHSFIRHQRQQK